MGRRQFLRGVGAMVALPSLEGIVPGRAMAGAGGAPLRMAFVYAPNGVNVARWRPEGVGEAFSFGPTLEPLADLRGEVQVLSGFEHKNGWAGADGAGDHARASATILTGARPFKTAGADIRLGVSVDQLAAREVGHLTRFPSLELSCDTARKSGACDSGYACAYQFNLSWRNESTPVAAETNPRLVFERLFGAGGPGERQENFRLRQARQKSVLDFVMEDARSLQRQLGKTDRGKLEEYLVGVREIEERIQRAEKFGPPADPGVETPTGVPGSYRDHLRLMFDMLELAFRTDSTRIATFMMAHDGSNRSFPEIGVAEGHHHLSHHQDNPEKLAKIGEIDRFYVEQFAYFLERLREARDGDGRSVLDNSMIVYCSGLSDGNRHAHDNLPVILAGRGGGALRPGRHVEVGQKTPMTNLYVSMLARMGVPVERFGDSTGALALV